MSIKQQVLFNSFTSEENSLRKFIQSFESFFLDKIYLGIKRMEMGRKLFGQ